MDKTSAYDRRLRHALRALRPRTRPVRIVSAPPERYPPRASCLVAAGLPRVLLALGPLLSLNLLLALARPAYGQPANPSACVPDIGKEVVTQADLLRHGLFRLADVLAFSARWSAASVDGYHWQTAPAGFPDGAARWSLYIDDIPASPRVLGRNRLNALPIALSDVACVEIVSGLDMGGPAFLPGGALRIYTKRPAFGLSIQAAVTAGNEINDPGPFRYTLPETVNIDRTGPIHAASLSVGKQTGAGQASGRLDEHHVMDAALRDRTRRLYDIPDTQPHIRTRALRFAGGYGRQRVLAGFAHTGDMAFFPETGLEIPVTHRMALWGAAGSLPLWRGGIVRYAVSTTRDALPLRQNREDIDLDWAQRRVEAQADLRLRRLRAGGRLQTFRAETSQRLADETLFDLRLFGGIDLGGRPQKSMRLALEWARRETQHGAVAYIRARRRAFLLAGSYGAAPPDPGSRALWRHRGYALPYGAFEGLPGGREKRLPLPRRVTLDAGWMRMQAKDLKGLSGSLLAFYRGFRNELQLEYDIARQTDQDGLDTSGFDTTARLVSGIRGHTGGVFASLAFRPLPALRQRISGAYEAVRHSRPHTLFYADNRPRLRLVSATELVVDDRFSLSALIQYASATRWPEYEDALPETWRLPARWLLNATAAKRMAADRLNVSLGLRNILNEPMRFHPAGAVFYMEFYFSVAARFTSAAGF